MTPRYLASLASAFLLVACGDSTTNPPTTVTLTVANVFAWCTLSVTSPAGTTLPNGATAASNVITLPLNTTATLHAEPTSGFIWATTTAQGGGWSGDLDVGTDPLSKTVSVTLGSNKSITVCCPFPNGSGCT